MKLIIVESPTKSTTISKFLGKEYKVLSSYGHVRDLPKNKLAIDTENNFEPTYVIPTKARKNVGVLKKEAEKADSVILATDEDREGEAISYHLAFILDLLKKSKPYQRIAFHEITKPAIKEALKNPRQLNMDLVEAQQARRVLDRIVGYKLSPFLWKKVARGLSAGRVQSVAVRLVVEREREIANFKPEEYWSLEALLQTSKNEELRANLIEIEIKNQEEADEIIEKLDGAEFKVSDVDKKEKRRNPFPPFTTSTLQQSAWKKFKLPAKMTMGIAQQLYEKGFITYHRTDSLNLSQQSLLAAKDFINKTYGKDYWSGAPRKFKTKSKGAQEAHEAIRPVDPNKAPESLKLDPRQAKLYALIWQRFIASQMSQAIFNSVSVDILANDYTFRATGQTLKFDGFLRAYPVKYEEMNLPKLKVREILRLKELVPDQHFTQPPARYNEASLIKALEQHEIGRPSTYAPTLSTIQERNYIEKNEDKRFCPTEIGTVVNDLLVKHFPEIVDIDFTAKMEADLDDIAEGKKEWVPVMKEFYVPFNKNLEEKYKEVSKKDVAEKTTDKKCPKCGSPLLIKLGRYGKFYACSGFPECRHTESLEENKINVACPECHKGKLVEKRTKKRKVFYGCDQFPKCDFALWDKPTGKKCPECKSLLVETNRKQTKCSNKECGFVLKKE